MFELAKKTLFLKFTILKVIISMGSNIDYQI